MKKYLLGAGVLVLLLIVIAIPRYQKYGLRAKRAEGLAFGTKISVFMEKYKSESGTYPGMETITAAMKDEKLFRYKWGVGKEVEAHCKDCMITPDSFKIAVYANIDQDPEMDLMYVTNGIVNPVVVKDDSL